MSTFGIISPLVPMLLMILYPKKSKPSVVSDIPHRGSGFDEFLSIKPRIPLAEELEQVLVLVGQIQNYESLSGDIEHMNPHEVMEHPACSRVLDALALLVWEGRPVVLEGIADAILSGGINE
jgi:hypothetical protein